MWHMQNMSHMQQNIAYETCKYCRGNKMFLTQYAQLKFTPCVCEFSQKQRDETFFNVCILIHVSVDHTKLKRNLSNLKNVLVVCRINRSPCYIIDTSNMNLWWCVIIVINADTGMKKWITFDCLN